MDIKEIRENSQENLGKYPEVEHVHVLFLWVPMAVGAHNFITQVVAVYPFPVIFVLMYSNVHYYYVEYHYPLLPLTDNNFLYRYPY